MEREAKEALILRLFRAYPGGENKVSRATVDTYLEAVDYYPFNFVRMGIEQFITGQVPREARNRAFVPSCDELSTHIRVVQANDGKVQRLLEAGRQQFIAQDKDAEVEQSRTPEAMARVRSMMEGFVESVDPKQKTPAEIARAKDDYERLGVFFKSEFYEPIPGRPVSSALLKRLGYETFNSADTDDMDAGEDR